MVVTIIILSNNILSVSASSNLISLRQAMDSVSEHFPNATIESFNRRTDDCCGSVYEFIILDSGERYSVTISTENGEIQHFAKTNATARSSPNTPGTSNTAGVVSPHSIHSTGTITSAEQAREIALAHVSQGTVVRHETKKNHYKVCIQADNLHYDIDVNLNGTIKKEKVREITFTSSKASIANTVNVIGFDTAADTARQRVGNGTLIENKLDYKSKEGSLIYKVNIVDGQTEHKMEICALSGSILKYNSVYKG